MTQCIVCFGGKIICYEYSSRLCQLYIQLDLCVVSCSHSEDMVNVGVIQQCYLVTFKSKKVCINNVRMSGTN